MNKKILVSGVKPTGRPHVGNYFGAMKHFVDMQDEFQSYIFVADLHALTNDINCLSNKSLTEDLFLDYLAIGIDVEKTILFKQSLVSEHTELAWIFECLATIPYLMRAHAYKDAEAKNKEISVGVFNYPMLMTADILMYDADVVPVGKDQKQHIEIARDMALKFNFQTNSETFKAPQEYIIEETETVPGIDGQKMSKSYNNTIPLFSPDEEIKNCVMKIPTDSKSVEEPKDTDSILFKIHSLILSAEDKGVLQKKYQDGGLSYKEAKEMLINDLVKFISPLRDRRKEYESKKDYINSLIIENSKKAKIIASAKMEKVRKLLGIG